MKFCKVCAIVTLFLGQLYTIVLGSFFIHRNVPYHSVFCETYNVSITDYPCVMDGGFVCITPANFLIDLKVKCGDVVHTVYNAKESHCECCDPNYSKWCMTHWNSNTWYPWLPNKFPLISTSIKDYQSSMEYFEQNGIIYHDKNEKK